MGAASAEPVSTAQQSPRVGFHVLAVAKTTGIQVCSQGTAEEQASEEHLSVLLHWQVTLRLAMRLALTWVGM